MWRPLLLLLRMLRRLLLLRPLLPLLLPAAVAAVDGIVVPRTPEEAAAHGGLRASGQGPHGAHFQGQVV